MAAVVRPDPARVPADLRPEALGFLKRRLGARHPCTVLTGQNPALRSDILESLAARGRRDAGLHWALIPAPTDSPQAFLEALLAQLGFEPTDCDGDALRSLLAVFLQHEAARGRRLIVCMDHAEDYGPRVLDGLDQLLEVQSPEGPVVSLVLAGSRALDRVLDSPGMARLASLTRERFDLDGRGAWLAPPAPHGRAGPAAAPARTEPAPAPAPVPSLTVLLEGRLIQRVPLAPGRMLIGRGRQCELRLAGRHVSRLHALVLVTGGSAVLVDLASTNGTRVNGRPAGQQLLQPGDLIDVGNFQLCYTLAG